MFNFYLLFLGWAAMSMVLNSVQIFSNISNVLLNIICIILVISVITSYNKIIKRITSILLALVISINTYYTILSTNYHHSYSENYLKKIYNYSNKISSVGAFMLNNNNNNTFRCASTFSILGNYLAYCNNMTFPFSISILDIPPSGFPFEIEAEQDLINQSPFSQYVLKQKQNGSFFNIEQSKLDFIEKFKMNYLILKKRRAKPQVGE